MQPTCFVIQPFDNGGEFDRRFEETYEPAIKAGGLVPYRVDADPSASIPIETIEKSIREAEVCFADITLDNPNVWFEVGLAIAYQKEICLICSDHRTRFPFDVQHRLIIRYSTSSQSDFNKLSKRITDRLKAIVAQIANRAELPAAIAKTSEAQSEIDIFEVATVGVLASETVFGDRGLSEYNLRRSVSAQGFTDLAVNVSIRKLLRLSFIETDILTDRDGDSYSVFSLSDKGWVWVESNLDKFNLTKSTFGKTAVANKAISRMANIDDDIPF